MLFSERIELIPAVLRSWSIFTQLSSLPAVRSTSLCMWCVW